MKRILYVFALLVVSAFAAEAQQRVEISTIRIPKGDHIKFVSPVDKSVFAPAVKAKPNGKSLLPEYLLAAPVEVGFVTTVDTSDSAFVLTSKVDPNKRTLTGVYDFPVDLTGTPLGYNILSPAQFVAGLNGELIMDTVAFTMFKLPTKPALQNNMLLFVVTTSVDMNAPSYNGLRVGFDDLTIVGSQDGYNISADTVNNRLDETTNQLLRVIIPLETPITIPAGQSFGFVVYPVDAPEEFRMFGVREWGLQPKETLGSMLRRSTSGADTVATFWSSLSYNNSVLPDYPALANKGIAINYDFFISGTFDAQTSVQPVSKEAGFTLEQNTPNPVADQAMIQFSVTNYSNVSLRVYNTLGQEVAELANGNFDAGTWKADFNTKNLPAGSYVYVLNANGQTITRTLQVVR